MIKDVKGWREWEDVYERNEPVDPARNFRLQDEFLEEARKLGVFPPEDPWEGFDIVLQMVRGMHGHRAY